jgi:hypothetical protein
MKKIFLTLIILGISQAINALSIQELSASPSSDNDINIHIKVIEGYYFEYSNHSYTIANNTITLTICYLPITLSIITTKENDFVIPNINTDTSNYTLVVIVNYLRMVAGQQVCDYQSQSDTATLQFSTPVNATVTLSSDDFVNNEKKLIVFPNPTNGILAFSNDFTTKLKSIKIFDNSGRLVQSTTTFNNNSINLKEFENGIYFINFITDKEKISKKIVLKK